ncbi:Protein export cytoplasm protein SecA ATPase RNA helicase [Methanosarcina siciliae T4/M]|uniref:Protein export cytoplasm protein SecA ATPase RNA helicase n=1 Tax=Methanosarcina siciliae T4/M TaxID=1434120 RepID=A0A0E3P446_9EURY|nr:hypothetical protein [Methanosarcina siciliae]AKB28317.1 Protein export cytoplasm protein SecA ATPase RNA helicase [Methanosarcina siciliae T4/M]
MKKKEYDFDTEIKNYLAQKGYVRRRQLIEDLMKAHKNERGYSLKSINRKLDNLINHGIIISLKHSDFGKLGIEDADKRASYLTLKNISKIKEHMDKILKRLASEEPIKQKMALKEIALYEQVYVLTPEQLDLVVKQFDKGIDKGTIDDDLANTLLLLLYTYILKKCIEPTNKAKTIDLLVKLLDKYPVPVSTHVNLRTHIIYLLGHYGHKAVIERFMEDARTLKDPFSVENVYNTEYTANLIEEHREELYKLEEELAIEGKDNALRFVSNIRTQALINLGLHENPYTKGKKEVDDSW